MSDPFDPFNFDDEQVDDAFPPQSRDNKINGPKGDAAGGLKALSSASSPRLGSRSKSNSNTTRKIKSKRKGTRFYNIQSQEDQGRRIADVDSSNDIADPPMTASSSPFRGNSNVDKITIRPTTSPKSNRINKHQYQQQIEFKGENSVDSDIFSHLFQSPSKSQLTNENRNHNRNRNETSPTNPNEIQIKIYQSEHMSCIYDSAPNSTPVMDIKGTINIKPTTDILGRTFYIALQDPERHLKEVTSFFEIAKEVNDLTHIGPRDEHPFVKKHQQLGNRIYNVNIPQNTDCLSSDPFQILKYTGSEFLRPIPLLVSTKVRVAGKVCRVGVKIRSNPSNRQKVKNTVVLIAIPPDVNGESMKMSLEGGVWDPIKRIIIYKCEDMKCGETVDIQLQFEYLAPSLDAKEAVNLPRFPVLVRCDGVNDQLSSVELRVGGTLDDIKKYYALKMDKTYKLFHRKI